MPKQNDIWNEAFSNPDLSSEDWLEPSADLFDKIEQDIASPKRKRRFGFIYFLLGLLSIVFLIGFFFRSVENGEIDLPEKISINNVSALKNNKVDESTIFNEKANNSDNYQNEATNFTEKQRDKINSSPKILDIDKGSITEFNFTESNDRPEKSKEFKLETAYPFAPAGAMDTAKSTLATAKKSYQTVPSNARHEASLLTLSGAQNIFLDVPKRKFTASPMIINTSQNSNRRRSISFFTGVSVWGFHLNNNYLTALDPADFTFESGNGRMMGFKYEHHLKNNFSVYGTLSWDRVVSYSGHNSNVNYDLQNENSNLSNTLDLTMASPFGLLQSDVVVSRNSTVSPDQTSLVLDLHNRHQFDNIGLSTGLAYALLSQGGFELSSYLGFGLNHLAGLENELESFEVSSSNFSSGQTIITESQQAVKTLYTQVNLGVDLRRSIGEYTQVGASVDYVRGLSDVYREDDFSSRLSTRRYNISISRRF